MDRHRGKKRVLEEAEASSVPDNSVFRKRKTRAETRPCPICEENIPLRLLGKHAELEAERVEIILCQVGSEEPVYDDWDLPGPSSRSRRSAMKARKSISTSRNNLDSLEQTSKTIQSIKLHRKQRYIKLKELAREEVDGSNWYDPWSRRVAGGNIVCPVCSETVRGDQDVLEAHVDACVAYEGRRLEEARQRELEQQRNEEGEWEEVSNGDGRVGHVGNIQGTGFHVRDRLEEDVDEEVDIDGDDQAVYGGAQFTEGDVLPGNEREGQEGGDVEVENEDDPRRDSRSLRDLVAEGKVLPRQAYEGLGDASLTGGMEEVLGVADFDKLGRVLETARRRGDKTALISALENKIKHLESTQLLSSTSLLCRICLDAYTEPTVSTGCWHTCCRECWLRCLGSTKLCPICKRITAATDLRRIYL